MPSYQLNLIRNYCDTTGIRLSSFEKDLLCKVLENPAKYGSSGVIVGEKHPLPL